MSNNILLENGARGRGNLFFFYFFFKKKIEILFPKKLKGIQQQQQQATSKENRMSYRTIIKEQGKYCDTRVVDWREHLKCLSGDLADCAGDSLEMYFKLRRAGAVRVKGKRQIERDTNDPRAYHFWVENRGVVFERHGGVQTIVDKEMFYNNHHLTDVEIGEYSGFFRDELPNNEMILDEMKRGVWGDRALFNLIQTYKKKQKYNKGPSIR